MRRQGWGQLSHIKVHVSGIYENVPTQGQGPAIWLQMYRNSCKIDFITAMKWSNWQVLNWIRQEDLFLIVSICHCLPPLLPYSPLSHHLNPQTKDQEKFASENMRLCSLLLSSTLLASLLPSSLSQAALQFCDEPGLHYCMYQVKYWVSIGRSFWPVWYAFRKDMVYMV